MGREEEVEVVMSERDFMYRCLKSNKACRRGCMFYGFNCRDAAAKLGGRGDEVEVSGNAYGFGERGEGEVDKGGKKVESAG